MPSTELSTFELFIKTYGGWIGFALVFLYFKVWPLIADKLIPAKIKEGEERAAAIEDERKWLRQMFAEQVEALQAIKTNLVQINADNTAIREQGGTIVGNQQTIIQKQDMHHNEMLKAVGKMDERVARMDGIAEGKRLPKTGPLQDDKPKP